VGAVAVAVAAAGEAAATTGGATSGRPTGERLGSSIRSGGAEMMAKEHPHVRITNQFRKRTAMVYDLSCDDIRLTIEVTPRDTDDGSGEWIVQAHVNQAPEKPTVDESGATRGDALGAVARTWAAKRGTFGFPALDWEAVTKALLAVRAI
jgi:hypothetical protein